jgi:hypothetical protein
MLGSCRHRQGESPGEAFFHVGAHELLGWGDIMTPISVNLNRTEPA